MCMNHSKSNSFSTNRNTIQTTIPNNYLGHITCVCNSNNYQKVTVTIDKKAHVFEGIGKGALMTLEDKQTSCRIETTRDAKHIETSFQYYLVDKSTFLNADQINEEKGVQGEFEITKLNANSTSDEGVTLFITVTSSKEITDRSKPNSNLKAKFAPEPTGLSLHAKTYYNNPNIHGGDEHYIQIPKFEGRQGTLDYSGPFILAQSSVYLEYSALGGYFNIVLKLRPESNSDLGGSAILTLTTSYGFWFVFPTGHGSTSWSAALDGSKYQVTRVTN